MEIIGLILGTYALSTAITQSDGPWGVLYRIRNNELVKDFGLLECFICVSMWVSILLTIIMGLPWYFILIAWGASLIIDKLLLYLFTK